MKRPYVVCLALLTTFVFGAILAASAFAGAEWLISEAPVTSLASVTLTLLLTLTDLKASFLGASSVDCEGSWIGSVGSAGEGEITEIIGAEGKKTKGNGLTSEFIECKGIEGCEGNGLVYPIGMPWLSQIELINLSQIINKIVSSFGGLGFAIECSIFGIKEEDECTQVSFGPKIELMPSEKDVLLIWSESSTSHCSLSGENSGHIFGEALVAVLSGFSLSIIDF